MVRLFVLTLALLPLGLVPLLCAQQPPAAPPSLPPALGSFQAVTVTEGLENPWSLAWLPDGTMLVTERPGRLRYVRNGVLDPRPIAGVPAVYARGQGGLFEVALHPRFAENGLVYLSYAAGNGDANHTAIARGRLDGYTLADVEVIFTVTQDKPGSQHFGGRLLWLPDGTLLASVGDGGNPPTRLAGDLIRNQAQNAQSRLGKLVRLRDDGTLPPDNPLAGRTDADGAVWSLGHRNIQGLAQDAAGRLWATEHGARGGDELNLVQAGQNYGWPVVSFSREYASGQPVARDTTRAGMEDPRTVWTPSIGPSGLAFYTGDAFPAWRGDLLAGSLVFYDLRRLDLDAEGRVVGEERLPIGHRVRDVRQGPDGLVYVLTDEREGRLLRLQPAG